MAGCFQKGRSVMKSVFMGACGVLVAVLAAAAETEVVDGVTCSTNPVRTG